MQYKIVDRISEIYFICNLYEIYMKLHSVQFVHDTDLEENVVYKTHHKIICKNNFQISNN